MSIQWQNGEGDLNGTRLKYITSGYDTEVTTSEQIVVLKGPWHYNGYKKFFQPQDVKNILEFGIFEGGSAFMLADMFPEAKIVGIDMRRENPAVIEHIRRLGLQDRIHLHHGVLQDDRKAVAHIIASEFTDDIDLIIDDCSHWYAQTRASFEVSFPHLKPGGHYVIEDWDWAHYRNADYSRFPSPPLSQLVFELTMAITSSPTILTEAQIIRGMAVFTKGNGTGSSNIDDLIYIGARGRAAPL